MKRFKWSAGTIALALLAILNGGITKSIPPRYAEIAGLLGLGPQPMGLALAGETVGIAVVAALLAAGLAKRFGSRASFGVPLVLFCLSPALVAIAHSGPALFATQVYQGATNAPVDLAQNSIALSLSPQVGPTLLPAVEMLFSVGATLGSLVGAWSAGNIGVFQYLVGVSAVAVPLAVLSWLMLPGRRAGSAQAEEEQTAFAPPIGAARGWALVVLAFFGLMAEFSAQDWSSLFYRFELHARVAEYGYGPAAFNVAFILALASLAIAGKAGGGRLRERLGNHRVVRVSGAVFALGMFGFVTSHTVWVATAGLFLAGLGAAPFVPLIMESVQGQANVNVWISRLTVGLYLGPGGSRSIGLLTSFVTLRQALTIEIAIGLIMVFLAGLARKPVPARTTP